MRRQHPTLRTVPPVPDTRSREDRKNPLDERIAGVAAVRMLAAYRLLVDHPYYNQLGHWFVPGALLDYDLPDLPALVAPRPVAIIDSIDHMSRRLEAASASRIFGYARGVYAAFAAPRALTICRTAGTTAAVARALSKALLQP